jgi:hypothetical protein
MREQVKARDQDTLAPLDTSTRARTSTIVQPANQDKCRAPRLLELIRQVADSASHLAYEASLLANAHFTRLLGQHSISFRILRDVNEVDALRPLPADLERFYSVCLALCKHGVREATLTQAWELFPGLQETANELYGVGILAQTKTGIIANKKQKRNNYSLSGICRFPPSCRIAKERSCEKKVLIRGSLGQRSSEKQTTSCFTE